MTHCFQRKYLYLPYPSPQFAASFSVATLVCIAIMLSSFMALVPFCHFSKTENGEDFRSILHASQ